MVHYAAFVIMLAAGYGNAYDRLYHPNWNNPFDAAQDNRESCGSYQELLMRCSRPGATGDPACEHVAEAQVQCDRYR